MPTTSVRRFIRAAAMSLGGAAALFLVLAVPAPAPRVPSSLTSPPTFAWNRDTLWQRLEAAFVRARAAGCSDSLAWTPVLARLGRSVDALRLTTLAPTDPALDTIEASFFDLAPLIAACPARLDDYVALYARMRQAIKWQSRRWDMRTAASRDRLYRSLYGGRAAVEEVMLQHPDRIVALLPGTNEPSATPAAVAHGVELHSGDIIVSRGGYPTSALIARGNDYPGNFSHVALVYVDSATRDVSVIEAHIELGVAISSLEKYLSDKKLRMMLLRPRADLPALRADPMLPHRAASAMMDRARAGHIPYDFAMDYHDPSRLFCSEVASSAYHDRGVDLWMGISTISSPGVRRWLASFGVRHFETQEPSDLEYDPQLVVVGEWRDAEALFQDHVDNAVTDVLLEGAGRGERLRYPWYQLPGARLAKGYSWVLERFARIGPIPEGMSAAAALRNRAFTERHRRLATQVRAAADAWASSHGYRPPYWTLVELARTAVRGGGRVYSARHRDPDARPA
jgi:Permuted papain-like amidase enzyme, YaeF/YiiX, C92 family